MFEDTNISEANILERGASGSCRDEWPAWPHAKRAFAPGWRRAALKENRGDRSLRPWRGRNRQAIHDFAAFAVERELFPTANPNS